MDPPTEDEAGVERYFSTAAFIIESACEKQGFHFQLTASMNSAPLRGPKVLSLSSPRKMGRLAIPDSVGIVFKCYGAKPSTSEWFGIIHRSCCLHSPKTRLSGSELWSTDGAGGSIIFAKADFSQRLIFITFL